MRPIRSTLAMAVVAATILSITLSSVAAAASWGDPVTIWASNAETYGKVQSWPGNIVAAGDSNLVASYSEAVMATGAVDAYVTRSPDGGATWLPRVRVSRPGSASRQSWNPSLSSYGSAVDAAWLEDSSTRGIRYSHSLDGGATFSPSVALSRGSGVYPQVARGPNGHVVVAWYAWSKAKLFVRVSHDSGSTFDPKTALWTVPTANYRGFSVAVGDGVMYAGFGTATDPVRMRSSLDGVHWSPSTSLTNVGSGALGFQLVAEDQQVYLGYAKPTSTGSTPWVRRSTNGGVTWSPGVKIAPENSALDWPHMNLAGGVLRVIYGRNVTTNEPATTEVFYQESSNGSTWTAPVSVSTTPPHYSIPIGVAHGDHTVVAYKYWAPINYSGDIQIRVGAD
jgi:hypothetical protein